MSDQNPQPQKQTLNLQTISQNFLAGMQRHFDMLAFNLACRKQASLEGYTELVQRPKLLPLPQAHMNFEQMEAFSYDLLQRNFINDMLQMSVACMDNCFLLCNLISRKQEMQEKQQETNKLVQEEQQAFARKPLHEKFESWESRFGFMTDYEDTLISMGMCLQCMVQKGGIVSETETEEGQLSLEFKKLKDDAEKGVPAEKQLETVTKSFKPEDRIHFAEEELQYMIVTVTAFFHELFQFISHYAQEQETKSS